MNNKQTCLCHYCGATGFCSDLDECRERLFNKVEKYKERFDFINKYKVDLVFQDDHAGFWSASAHCEVGTARTVEPAVDDLMEKDYFNVSNSQTSQEKR